MQQWALQACELVGHEFQGQTVLDHLRLVGLSLAEIQISPLSSVKGQLVGNIMLPSRTRLACIVRNGRALLDLDAVFLEENDVVYLLTDDKERAFNCLAL